MSPHGITESSMPHLQPSLPSNRAFVVSGQVLRFHSPEELLAFLARVLTEVQEQPCAW
jgi:hypothetical protein